MGIFAINKTERMELATYRFVTKGYWLLNRAQRVGEMPINYHGLYSKLDPYVTVTTTYDHDLNASVFTATRGAHQVKVIVSYEPVREYAEGIETSG